MQQQTRQARAEAAAVFFPWGPPMDARASPSGSATLWLTGGASLLLWTAIALVLTSA